MTFDPPIYLNVRDRVTPLRELVEWLESAGHERITLIDNASSYEPMLDYLAASPHDVIELGQNLGARAIWQADLAPDHDWYVYTDPDIVPTEACPLDAIEHLRGLLDRHPRYPKAGLGLYLEDVPHSFRHLDWERTLVAEHRLLEPGVYGSMVDTTFALYRPGAGFGYDAIRTGHPYQARHISPSWYGGELTGEDRYYLQHARSDDYHGSTWARDAA